MLLRPGLFTLHVESAARGRQNPDETLKKNSFNVAGEEKKKGSRQLALLQFSFHARENLETREREGKDTLEISRYPRWI